MMKFQIQFEINLLNTVKYTKKTYLDDSVIILENEVEPDEFIQPDLANTVMMKIK